MEAVENAFVEGKVLWLAQTILEITSSGKLGEWIRHVGLGGGMEKLTSEIERIETVVAGAKGRATGNKPLARSLARLKELLYDADDLVDELDYFRLQEQVEGGGVDVEGDGGIPDLGIGSSKKRKNRCKEWDHFGELRDGSGKLQRARCKYCYPHVNIRCDNGTKGLNKHFNSKKCQRNRPANHQPPNPTSATDAAPNDITDATRNSFRGKRMRIDQASTHSTASNTCSWDKDEFSNSIHQIVSELQGLREEVCDFLKDSVACSDQYQSNTETRIRTSSFAPEKVYGRDVEKEYIIRVITAAESDSITVLPIVGIVGVGKTALARLVYNDPAVKSEFERIWVWVSDNFDEVRLTGEMLDVVCDEGSPHNKEKHERIGNYSKLQEILQENMGCRSKRFLLVLDDVSDRMDNTRWKQLLAPLESSDEKGNVIVITTRNLSVARRLGTVQPRKLGALENEAFWLLFKACAFGDDNYQGYPSLTIIGRQIAAKLKGNPLAAETAGELLNEHLTRDHWNSILKSEDWKSMQFNKSIMHALKLSYDKLPYNVQQCFLYCSIFPDNYEFFAEDLIFTWISQGFMRRINSSKTPEQIGQDFLNYLVNLCFFEQVERKDSTLGNRLCYVMCGIVHDFARLISRTEYAAIDGTECNEMLPTTRHLSILTDSAYCKRDQHWNLCHNLKFEEKLRGVVKSAIKLRTLVLIGKYDSFFFRSFEDVFQEARCLHMLQMSATYADFSSFLSKLVSSAHLRYLKLDKGKSSIEELHLSKFYHLQVLDVGHATTINDMSGLVSMRHLVVKKGAHFMDPNSICLEMAQLESMNEPVHLGVHQLQNVNGAEVCGAKMRIKQHLANLHLSWKVALSQDGYDSDTSSEHYTDTESEEENWPMDGVNNMLTSEQFTNTAKEVLDVLEPCHNLKHLQISGYRGATSPNWFSSFALYTCLQTLHLEDCGEWHALPSLETLPFLTKLELSNMSKVTQVSIPPLEELVLTKMTKLERCSCNSTRDLNSSLRVLMIKRCKVLKVFPLFESCDKLRIEHTSWLSGLSELIIHDCPLLIVSNPLPPSSSTCELSISRVSTLPTMKGSPNSELIIGAVVDYVPFYDEDSNELRKLDDKILAFHNLRVLTHLKIAGCKYLSYVSLEGFRQLVSLKSLEILGCVEFFSSDVLPKHAHEDIESANFNAFPTLKHLSIISSVAPNKISGKWLSAMLRHAPVLEELHLKFCNEISGLVIEGKESYLSDHNSSPRASSPGNPDDASTSSAQEGVVHIPSNLVTSLKKMSLCFCYGLSFLENFSAFTSLEELEIVHIPELIASFGPKDENSELFPRLERLRVNDYSFLTTSLCKHLVSLQRLELHACFDKVEGLTGEQDRAVQLLTSLQDLKISDCIQLVHLPVCLHSLSSLRRLKIIYCGCVLRLPEKGLPPSLEELEIKGCCKELTSECRMLATSMLKVEIDGDYVN